MAEYAKIVLDNDMFYNVKKNPDMCIVKNDAGNIEILGNSDDLVNDIYDVLSSSSGKYAYSDKKMGVEYVLSKLVGPTIEYSSDYGFIDEDFNELAPKLNVKKSLRVITTKKRESNE